MSYLSFPKRVAFGQNQEEGLAQWFPILKDKFTVDQVGQYGIDEDAVERLIWLQMNKNADDENENLNKDIFDKIIVFMTLSPDCTPEVSTHLQKIVSIMLKHQNLQMDDNERRLVADAMKQMKEKSIATTALHATQYQTTAQDLDESGAADHTLLGNASSTLKNLLNKFTRK